MKKEKMKEYVFTIQMTGVGLTKNEAYEDAIDGFINNPDPYPVQGITKVLKVTELEEDPS